MKLIRDTNEHAMFDKSIPSPSRPSLRMSDWIDACISGNVATIRTHLALVDSTTLCRGWFGACDAGHIEVVRLLVERVAPRECHHALERAVTAGNLEIVRVLIQHQHIEYVHNAQIIAASNGHLNIVQELRNCVDTSPEVILQTATEYGHGDIMMYAFKELGAKQWNQALMCAARQGHTKVIPLIAQHYEPKCHKHDWDTALIIAAKYAHPELVQLLNDMCIDGVYMPLTQAVLDKSGESSAMLDRRFDTATVLLQRVTNYWFGEFVRFLMRHPQYAIEMVRRGRTSRDELAKQSVFLGLRVDEFFTHQKHVHEILYNILQLPRVLCDIIIAY